jgi:hypothetical protein
MFASVPQLLKSPCVAGAVDHHPDQRERKREERRREDQHVARTPAIVTTVVAVVISERVMHVRFDSMVHVN